MLSNQKIKSIAEKGSIYGLKQAPIFYNKIHDDSLNLSFQKSQSKATLYAKHVEANILIILYRNSNAKSEEETCVHAQLRR